MRRALENSKFVFFIVIFLAGILRILGLTTRYIWYDEAFSLLLSKKGPSAILIGTLAQGNGAAAEEHPPLYYYLLNGWINIFGDSIPAARILSIIAGLGVVLLIYLLARELFDIKTANVAALLIAINPFQIHYSQEIRMYAFMALWLMLATYSFMRGRKSGDWKWWSLFAIFSALAQYTHNLSAFYLVALAVVPIFQRDCKTLKFVIFGSLTALILYVPWLIHIPAQIAKIQRAYWIQRPMLSRFFTLLLEYVSNPSQSIGWTTFALFTALTVFAFGLFQTLRALRSNKDKSQGGIFLFYLAFMPPILLFIFSQWIPVYLERALLPSGGIFCLWLAWAFMHTPIPNRIRLFAFSLVLISTIAGIQQHLTNSSGVYAPFDKIDASLRDRYQIGDVIIHSSKLSMLPAFYFDPNLPQVFISDIPDGPNDTLSPVTQKILGIKSEHDLVAATKGAYRIWFIILTRSIEEFTSAGATTHPQLQYLELTYQLDLHETWGGDEIYLFSRKPGEGR
jgi:4-amino-4-deoxy-L-arabinose transferase-like glycosyltransferase